MPKAFRCNHAREQKDHQVVSCANCGKRIAWASINRSDKIGFWFHSRNGQEACETTVATPVMSDCYHDQGKKNRL